MDGYVYRHKLERVSTNIIRQLIGPLSPATFSAGDFEALEVFEHRKRVKPVIDLLQTMFDDITAFDR